MLRLSIILFLALPMLPVVRAQTPEYLLEAFTYRHGLSDDRVRAVAQDEKGFLWVGTAYGLNRFDGYTFWHYFPDKNDSTSISSPTVNNIVRDRNGTLWMATGNGICRLRRGPWKFDRVFCYPKQIKSLRSAYFESVYCDPQGIVWAVNTNGELFRIDPESQNYEQIHLPVVDNPPATVPADYRQKPPRPVWVGACGDTAVLVGTNLGLFTLQLATRGKRFIPVPAAWPYGLSRFSPAGPGAYWCATFQGGLWRIRISDGAADNFPEPEVTPYGALARPDNKLWLIGISGLYEFDPERRRAHKIKLPFEEEVSLNANCLFRDKANSLWVGTDNGLVKYDPYLQGFRFSEVHRETSTIYENDIYDVHHDPDDGLWYVCSRQQSAIFVMDSTMRLRKRISTLPHVEPTRIFRDSKGRIWVTTRFQVLLLDRKTFTLRPMPTPPRREGRIGLIWSAAEDPQGRLWFGLSRDGLFILNPATGDVYQPGPETGFTAQRIYKVIIDRAGQYAWIATDNEGFFECDLATMKFRRFDDKDFEGLNSGGGLVQDGEGNVWIGTTQGLVRYQPDVRRPEAFRLFTVADGLPMNFLEGGILDKNGDLWFGAGDRLVRIHPRTLKVKVFDYRYGASQTPFGYCDFSISPDGELYAGARRGFLRWHPDRLRDNRTPPTVVVTNLRAAREDIPAPTSEVNRIWLPYNENNFRVEFAALNFTLPDDNRYQWKMEGYDDQWSTPSRQREAIYAHVPPGKYTLLVRAANNDGVWNEQPLSIQVQIFPAFWQTWWFRALVVLAMAGLIYGFIRWRVWQARERDRLQAGFNQRLAEMEMSALRAQMNPHFIFNCLNSINRYILLNQPLVASQYLTKFARLIRLVLDNSKSEMISLEKELETLRLYIEMEALRFMDRFHYKIDVDDAIDAGSIDIPPMLIQPYVENAIWHGLLHRKGKDGLLQININLKKDDLVIEVSDNGVGREAAQALKSKSASEHKSHGMSVTAERLKLLSNLYERDIYVNIQDLVLPDGSAAGTRVVLTVPVFH